MSTIEIKVPDIGDFHDVPVIEVLMKVGDKVEKEQPLLTLESDKATMEVPSDQNGEIKSVTVKVGDKVSQGMVIATIEVSAPAATPKTTAPATQQLHQHLPQQLHQLHLLQLLDRIAEQLIMSVRCLFWVQDQVVIALPLEALIWE